MGFKHLRSTPGQSLFAVKLRACRTGLLSLRAMIGTTRRLPAWEPEPLPLYVPQPPSSRTGRPSAPDDDDEREPDLDGRDERPGSHVTVIDIG